MVCKKYLKECRNEIKKTKTKKRFGWKKHFPPISQKIVFCKIYEINYDL